MPFADKYFLEAANLFWSRWELATAFLLYCYYRAVAAGESVFSVQGSIAYETICDPLSCSEFDRSLDGLHMIGNPSIDYNLSS